MAIIGHFYMKLTASGNILSEYSHTNMGRVAIEGANRPLKNRPIKFEGTYDTVWDWGKSAIKMKLKIVEFSATGIFELTWSDKAGILYFGTAFLVDGMLVGSYMDDVTYNAITNNSKAPNKRTGAN